MRRQWHQSLWLLLLAASLCLGQPSNTRTVTGVVTNGATSEPIQRALVQWVGQSGQLSAFTGADGRFSIENVPPNGVLSAQKPGFVSANQIPAGNGDVQVRLMPNGKITGHALDPDGEPIEHLQIQLLASQIVQGRRSWIQRGVANTDENGFYSLNSLPAGRYILHTLIQPAPATAVDAPALVYPPRYYPGASDLASAQIIQVTAGQDATVEISLQPERGFRVSGSVGGLSQGAPLGLSLSDADGQQISFEGSAADERTGQFTLEHVPAGSWTIAVANLSRQDFTVSGADVSGLQILVQPPAAIPLILNHSTGAAAQTRLIPEQGNVNENFFARPDGPSLPADTERHLVIGNVPPGRYRLALTTTGSGCIGSASSGSTDLTRDDLIVSPGSQPEPITINFDQNCATVSGTVASSGGPGVSGFAVAVPEEAQGGAKFTVFVDGRGFALTGLSPGTYRIYAFTNLDDLEYANPDALREYHGQQVDLQAGQQTNVTVEVNQRGSK
jgi:hypothetical protein